MQPVLIFTRRLNNGCTISLKNGREQHRDDAVESRSSADLGDCPLMPFGGRADPSERITVSWMSQMPDSGF